MPYHLQQVNAQAQSGSTGFHLPLSGGGAIDGKGSLLGSPGQEVEQEVRTRQRARARGLEKDADVDVHAWRRSNAQGQAQIVQSDLNALRAKAEAEAEQEQTGETGGSSDVVPDAVDRGSAAVGGPPWPEDHA